MRLSPDEMIFWQHGFLKLNGTIVFTWGLMLVLAVGSKLVTRNLSTDLKRSRWQNLLEIIVTAIEKQIEDVGLRHPEKYIGFLGTLFLFVAMASLCTVIPGYEPPTGSLSTTAALALCVFVAVPLFGIEEQGLGGYLKSYVEPTVIMLPFNIISELSRTLALAVRLFGNMMSGAMIIGILLTITPFIFPIVMTALGLLTGMVQAYIFTILAAVYIAAATREPQAQARAAAKRTSSICNRNKGRHHGQHDPHRRGFDRHRRPHDRLRQHGACARRRPGGRHRVEFAGAAARCLRHHHPDLVRRPGDDRVHRDLLLRGLDDPHFCQSVLEPRHRPSRGKVIDAHRLVHRRRASAQLPHPGVVAEALSVQAHSQCHRRAGEADRRGARGR